MEGLMALVCFGWDSTLSFVPVWRHVFEFSSFSICFLIAIYLHQMRIWDSKNALWFIAHISFLYNEPVVLENVDLNRLCFFETACVSRLLRVQTLDTEGTIIGSDTIFPHISFMHGGYYQLCYSPDGTMSGNEASLTTIVPVLIRVIGVASECASNGCLSQQRWDCFFSYRRESESLCRVDFRSSMVGICGIGWEPKCQYHELPAELDWKGGLSCLVIVFAH